MHVQNLLKENKEKIFDEIRLGQLGIFKSEN